MNTRIAYTRPDGGVSIIIPATTVEAAMATVPADATGVRVIDVAAVPNDRTFRDAWKPDFTVDMEKAREIHMSRIRIERDKELARLDIETLKGNDVQAEKQVLRDLPQTFDLTVAQTADELKALWPGALPR